MRSDVSFLRRDNLSPLSLSVTNLGYPPSPDDVILSDFLALVRDENKSVYNASKQTGVPYETSSVNRGRRTVNSRTGLICKMWLPQDREDVANMVKTFLESLNQPNPFNDGRP